MNEQSEASEAGNQPSHIIWQIIDSGKPNAKSVFRRVGAAWPNRKGNGFNMVIESIPLTGRIALLERNEADEESQNGASAPSAPAP